MYYVNYDNNRSLCHINFFGRGYESYIVGNLFQYVYHSGSDKTALSLFRMAKKYFKFKILLANKKSHYHNFPRLINASRSRNRSGGPLYIMAREKYESRSSIFSYRANNKSMSFSDIVHRYDYKTQVEDDFCNKYEYTFNL